MASDLAFQSATNVTGGRTCLASVLATMERDLTAALAAAKPAAGAPCIAGATFQKPKLACNATQPSDLVLVNAGEVVALEGV